MTRTTAHEPLRHEGPAAGAGCSGRGRHLASVSLLDFPRDLVLVGPKSLADLDRVSSLRWSDRADVLGQSGDLLLRVPARCMQIGSGLGQPAAAPHHRMKQWAAGQGLLSAGDDVANGPTVLLDTKHLLAARQYRLPG